MCRMAHQSREASWIQAWRDEGNRGMNTKEERDGCGRIDHTMRKCVDWNNGVPRILLQAIKAHVDSSIVTARGIVKGIYMFTAKESPVETLVFTNTRCGRDFCRGIRCQYITSLLHNCTLSPYSDSKLPSSLPMPQETQMEKFPLNIPLVSSK